MIIAGFSAYSRVIDWARFAAIADEVGAYFVVDMAHVAGLVAAGLYPNPLPHADVVTTTTHKTLRGPRGGMILARANEEIAKKLNSHGVPRHPGRTADARDRRQGGGVRRGAAAGVPATTSARCSRTRAPWRRGSPSAAFRSSPGAPTTTCSCIDLADRNITGKDADAALGRANITVNKNAVPNDPRPPMVTSGLRIGTPASTTRGFRAAEVEQVADLIAEVLDAEGAAPVVERVRGRVLELCRRFPVYGT